MADPTQGSDTSVAPSSGVSVTPEPVVAPEPTGPQYVYGAQDNVPEWLKGKTKEEVENLSAQMCHSVIQGTSIPNPPPAAPNVPPTVPIPATYAAPTAEDWMTDSATAADAHFTGRIEKMREEVFAPEMATLHQNNAAVARQLAEQRFTKEFSKWGPEIDLQMNQIAVDQRTPYMYEQAVGLVRGNHADEIGAEMLNAAVDAEIEKRTAAGSLRSGGGTGGSPLPTDTLDFNSSEVPEEYRRFKDIPESDLNQFLSMAYPNDPPSVARQKYMKQITKGNVITAGGS